MQVSQRIVPLRPSRKLWIVADKFPVWLVVAVSLKLPIELVYASEDFKQEFPEVVSVWRGLSEGFPAPPAADTLVLGSGSQGFLKSVRAKLRHHFGGMIFSLFSLTMSGTDDKPLVAASTRDQVGLFSEAIRWGESCDLRHSVVCHSDFGGATNGQHLLFYDRESGCSDAIFRPWPATPKTLRHLVGSAVRGHFQRSKAPPNAVEHGRRVIRWAGRLVSTGLLDMSTPNAPFICPSVFSPTHFVYRQLTPGEIMTAIDLPSRHQRDRREVPHDILWGLPSAIVTSVFLALWGGNGGGSGKPERVVNSTDRRRRGAAPKIPASWSDDPSRRGAQRSSTKLPESVDKRIPASWEDGPTRDGPQRSSTELSEGVDKPLSTSISDSAVCSPECSGGGGIDGEEALADGSCDAEVEPEAQKVRRGPLSSSHPLVCPSGKSSAQATVPAAPASQCPAAGGVGVIAETQAKSKDNLLEPARRGVGAGASAQATSRDAPSTPSRINAEATAGHPTSTPSVIGAEELNDGMAQGKDTNDFDMSNTPSGEVLQGIADERNNLRAVKSDKAEVKKEWWDEQIFGRTPTEEEAGAANTLRGHLLHRWARNVMEDCGKHMRERHGDKWFGAGDQPMKPLRDGGGELTELGMDLEAVSDIMWRAFNADWFTYPVGSRLHFMRFPEKYQKLARDGAPVFFEKDGPSQKRPQRDMPEDAKEVLREKLRDVIGKKYLDVPDGMVESLIQYFAVPKGVEDGKVKDWRIVYHAGANGLNDCVWTPSFWLPTAATLLRLMDEGSLMQDRDIGEMFLNFMLSREARKFTGVDLRPLGLSEEDCPRLWLVWVRNLMGFKASPYNSVRTYLIAEEIIRGDPDDEANALQWSDVRLNLPGTAEYVPGEAWISKRRRDGSLASDFVTFVDDQRVVGGSHERVKAAGHAISTRESYLGIQDALRKVRHFLGSRFAGAWAGVVVLNDEEKGIVQLLSQENWDKMRSIIDKWLKRVEDGQLELDHRELRSDRGFLVYACQAYPGLKPYLKGLHLSLETWRGGRDAEGYKLPRAHPSDEEVVEGEAEETTHENVEEEVEMMMASKPVFHVDVPKPGSGPESGRTKVVPRLLPDLKALSSLTQSETPRYNVVRSKVVYRAYYGFVDASSGGFGASVERPDGTHARNGLWGRDAEDASSNYRELRNLVETVEEEAAQGHVRNCELWIFTDNSTAESCFHKGSSSSKLLHELVLRLRKVEMDSGMTLYVVHCAGSRMIAQGTDALSRGSLLEGVMAGRDMLGFVDLARSAVERHPPLLEFVRDVTGRPKLEALEPKDWFRRGHGIIGGYRDRHGVWIPQHRANGGTYLWSPPPVVADAALEELLKAVQKRQDAYHFIVIPRIVSPHWFRLFCKLCDVSCLLPIGHSHWPASMHEPAWIGLVLPFIKHRPWRLKRSPYVVELEGNLRRVLSTGEGDGRDILRKLLQLPRRVARMRVRDARGLLRVPSPGGDVSHEDD